MTTNSSPWSVRVRELDKLTIVNELDSNPVLESSGHVINLPNLKQQINNPIEKRAYDVSKYWLVYIFSGC